MRKFIRKYLTNPLAKALPLMFIIALLASSAQAATMINTVYSAGDVGQHSSLALDDFGFPVISYYDGTNNALKLAHCNDVNCEGGDESILIVDSAGDVGRGPSLALDSSGNPVVSYHDITNGDLKLVHCNDPNCAAGDESIVTVDSGGVFTSLALDSSGFPVISHYDGNEGMKLVHCNDANCAGVDESIAIVESVASLGESTSLVLDGSGFPVVTYWDVSNIDLKLAHCNDANCAGGDESIVTVGNGGAYSSLALDSSGYPVVSYLDITIGKLKLVHCNDANCVGGDESIVTVMGNGAYSSLALDSSGFPVISHYDGSQGLKLVHCNDANCIGSDESIVIVDSREGLGGYASLVLDASGFPVVSYYDWIEEDLKLAHCSDPNCAVPAPEIDVQGNTTSIADGDTTPSTTDHTDFGEVALDGGSVTRTFTILNTGTADLILYFDPIGGPHYTNFLLTSDATSPVPPAGQTTFQVTFDPLITAGLRQATISIYNNDANESPHTFSIQGTATVPEMDVQGNTTSITDGDTTPSAADHTDFGSAAVAGGSVTRTFTIQNTGDTELSLTDNPRVTIGGTHAADFTLTSDATSPIPAAGGQTTFQVTFDPSAAGLRKATVSIANNDTDENPYNFSIQGTASTFPDVLPDHWAWQFVEAIFSAGLTAGFPDGTYRPDNPVTRAEMAVFLKKGIHGGSYSPPLPNGSHPFSDIAGHWAEAWIEDLFDEGFTSGFPDGTYRPENQVTRAEMAVFLKKAIHGSAYTSPTPDGSHPFSDISGHWAEAWIEDLYDEAITSGYPDGTYRPENQVTRAEMAVFLVNAFSLPLP